MQLDCCEINNICCDRALHFVRCQFFETSIGIVDATNKRRLMRVPSIGKQPVVQS